MAVEDGQAVTMQPLDGAMEVGATKCHPAHGDTVADGAALDGEVMVVVAKCLEVQAASAELGVVVAEQRPTNIGALNILV